jgi:hypothetical protein
MINNNMYSWYIGMHYSSYNAFFQNNIFVLSNRAKLKI